MTLTATVHRIEKVLDATPHVVVDNHRGDIRVHHDAPPGTVVIVLTSRREVDFAPVTTSCDADTVRVTVPRLSDTSSFGFSLGPVSFSLSHVAIDIDIAVPAQADVTVSTGVGDIVVSGTSGSLRARSGTGDIRAEDCADADLSCGTGDVRVDRIAGGALRSGAGDLAVGSSEGTLQAKTGVGDIVIGQAAGQVNAGVGAGDIAVRLTAGQLDARTGAGDIRVSVPVGIPVWRDLTSGLGEATSRIEAAGEPAPGQDHLRVTANSGTGDVTLTH